jgi:hypothetical protein
MRGSTLSTHDPQSEVIGRQYSLKTVIFQEFKPIVRVSAINQEGKKAGGMGI